MNVVHSIDAYVLRSLIRRCSYNPKDLQRSKDAIANYGKYDVVEDQRDRMVQYLVIQYNRSNMLDTRILSYLDSNNINRLDSNHIDKLNSIIEMMEEHKPFDVVTVHDELTKKLSSAA